jgi:predicted neuraminidase
MKLFGLASVTIAALFAQELCVAGAAVTQEFIFTKAPFASAHASTVVELKNGDLLSAWFGGSAEGMPDVAIWSARRTGGAWSRPAELVREPEIACYNPVLFYSADGRLWLYYKFGPHPSSWSAGRRSSTDDGKTWSPVEHLPAGLYGPIRAKPLVLADGTIVSGTSVESYHSWAAWIERSVDNGNTWSKIGPIAAPPRPLSLETYGIIQPSVVRLKEGTLRLYARSTEQIAKICVADSADGGRHWTAVHTLNVPNPNSGIDAVALPDGRVLLIFNNSTTGRTPLNLAVSTDGEHFRIFQTLEKGAGEFSYPAMIQGREGDIHITYTWNRRRIRYARLALQDVPAR